MGAESAERYLGPWKSGGLICDGERRATGHAAVKVRAGRKGETTHRRWKSGCASALLKPQV